MGRDHAASPNILLITLDQFRADCLSCAGHPVVRTPALDDLAAQGVRLARHYSQAAPCSPGRAALYTGTYQMNNRVVANGTPLDPRLDNIALAARRAGYAPALFDSPTRSSSCPALAFASARFTPSTRIGDSMMFSSTDRCGNRLKLWNTKPMRLRSLFSAALPMGAWMSWPSKSSCPDFTSSSRFTVRIS